MKLFFYHISGIFLVVAFYQNSIAQHPILDSLEHLLKKEKAETRQKADLLGQLAFYAWENDMQKTERYALACIKLSDKLQYPKGKGYALYSLGMINGLQAKRKLAEKYFQKAKELAQKTKNKALEGYIQYGKYYSTFDRSTDYKKLSFSIGIYEISLKLFQEAKCTNGLLLVYSEIADVYRLNAQFNQAREYLEKALALAKTTQNQSPMAQVYLSYALFHSYLGNPQKEAEYYTKSRELSEKYTNTFIKIELNALFAHKLYKDYRSKIKFYLETLKIIEKYPWDLMKIYLRLSIANVYVQQKDTSALQYLEDAFQISQKNQLAKIMCLNSLAEYYENVTKDYKKAIYFTQMTLEEANESDIYFINTRYALLAHYYTALKQFEKAESYLKKIPLNSLNKPFILANNSATKKDECLCPGFKEPYILSNYFKTYSDIEIGRGNYIKAIEYFKRFTEVKDSIAELTKNQTVEFFNQENRLLENNQQITLLKKEKEIEKQKAQNRQNLLVASLVGLLLLLIFAYILWRNNQLKQKANRQLTERNQLIDLLFSELNHRVLNNLQVVSLLLRTQKRKAELGNDSVNLEMIEARIGELANVHRLLMYGKNRQSIVDVGEYLGNITEVLSKLYQEESPAVKIRIDSQDLHLPMNQAYFLGFIVYELFTNSLKYAYQDISEPEFAIQIQQINQVIELQISDNGKGLPEELWENGKLKTEMLQTLGLKIVSSIAQIYQGSFEVCQPEKQIGSLFVARLVF